jgi:hypothetical protein
MCFGDKIERRLQYASLCNLPPKTTNKRNAKRGEMKLVGFFVERLLIVLASVQPRRAVTFGLTPHKTPNRPAKNDRPAASLRASFGLHKKLRIERQHSSVQPRRFALPSDCTKYSV